ncbi:MAG: hypothetical protein HOE10_09975, partial [Deltaproteobacteria bacterium]|nr:hypothetical protein [Deltaproteobacteria bacterium]
MKSKVVLSEIADINPRISKETLGNNQKLVAFVSMASVTTNGTVYSGEERKLIEVSKGYTFFQKGDVLLAKITPCFENGKAAVVSGLSHDIGFGSTEFHVLRPKKDVDVRYLFHQVWNPAFRFHGVKNMTGTAGQKRLPTDFLKRFTVYLPPLPEQKRIAAILDKADGIRKKREEALQLADEFLRATFLEMFGDPVTNPKGWEEKSLLKLTDKIGSGATPRGGKSAYISQGISLIRSLNVHDDKFIKTNLAFITNEQADALANVVVEKSDVLLNITGASVCRSAVVLPDILPARVNQHVCIIRPVKSKLNSTYLLHCLISGNYKKMILTLAGAGGATREALTKKQVENLGIPVPPIELQNKFAEIES